MTLPAAVRDRHTELVLSAAGSRHGLVLKAQVARTAMADLPGIWHVGVPRNNANAWSSAAGGVGRDVTSATLAAVGEALERYAAATCALPVRARSQIPPGETVLPATGFSLLRPDQVAGADGAFDTLYGDDARFTPVFFLHDNAPAWAPHALVGLGAESGLTTSSGLAAGSTSLRALLRAVQELVERDSADDHVAALGPRQAGRVAGPTAPTSPR